MLLEISTVRRSDPCNFQKFAEFPPVAGSPKVMDFNLRESCGDLRASCGDLRESCGLGLFTDSEISKNPCVLPKSIRDLIVHMYYGLAPKVHGSGIGFGWPHSTVCICPRSNLEVHQDGCTHYAICSYQVLEPLP